MKVPVLITKRLKLRPFTSTDAPALHAYASAPEYSHYVAHESPDTLEDTTAFMQAVLIPERDTRLTWAVCSLEDELIGTMLVTLDGDAAEVHYDLSHKWYGHGFTTEALKAVLAWCISKLDVKRFLGNTLATNIGSRRVMEKAGFTQYKVKEVQWEKFSDPVTLIHYELKADQVAV